VSQQLAIRHPERVKTLALFGSTPGLKRSHAPTWIPKISETGLKQFLADTIDERF
jgi:pimeloyl-ACP methyl ester carboxylesterase